MSVQETTEGVTSIAPAPHRLKPLRHAHLAPVYFLDLAPGSSSLWLMEQQHPPHMLVSGGSSSQQRHGPSGGQPGHRVT